MNNKIAIGIGLFLVAFFALNFTLGLDWHIFLGKKLLELVRWVAFWR